MSREHRGRDPHQLAIPTRPQAEGGSRASSPSGAAPHPCASSPTSGESPRSPLQEAREDAARHLERVRPAGRRRELIPARPAAVCTRLRREQHRSAAEGRRGSAARQPLRAGCGCEAPWPRVCVTGAGPGGCPSVVAGEGVHACATREHCACNKLPRRPRAEEEKGVGQVREAAPSPRYTPASHRDAKCSVSTQFPRASIPTATHIVVLVTALADPPV